MLKVALAAAIDIGVKGCRLSAEQVRVVRVTDDAVGCFDSLDRRVAGGAVILQR